MATGDPETGCGFALLRRLQTNFRELARSVRQLRASLSGQLRRTLDGTKGGRANPAVIFRRLIKTATCMDQLPDHLSARRCIGRRSRRGRGLPGALRRPGTVLPWNTTASRSVAPRSDACGSHWPAITNFEPAARTTPAGSRRSAALGYDSLPRAQPARKAAFSACAAGLELFAILRPVKHHPGSGRRSSLKPK